MATGRALPFRFIGANQVQWWEPGQAVHEGDLNGLAGATWERRPLLVVPGEFCVLSRVKLPVQNRRAFLQALPYALEEGLAEEVDSLHFAIGPLEDGEAAVAIISREVLASWLVSCAGNNLQVAHAVPEPLLLPWAPGDWSLLVEGARAVVRTGAYSGFACELESLSLLLELSLGEADQAPVRLRVWGEAPTLPAALDIVAEGEGRISLLDAAPVMLDLLQGSFGRGAQVGKWLRPWRAAALLVGLAVLLQLGGLLLERWQLSAERARLRAEQVRIYRQVVPDAVRVVNPRVQLQNRLTELAGGDGAEGFLWLLQQTGEILQRIPDLQLEGLRFQGAQLDLQLEGSDLTRFDELRQRLDEHPRLRAEVRTTRREDRAVSRVSVRAREGV